ncbi:MAG: ABC transporter ATP-binding protein [Lachnospiraceae bacterium]|nr:ABC transporter ATP-binding protein [Lachnospiraceae bacterium]
MIRAEGLCKSFKRLVKDEKGKKNATIQEEFFAVDHVDLQAGGGEVVGVLGPNGAGKTTLLRMLGCLMKPGEGRVVLADDEGREISGNVEIKKHIGYLSGNTRLYQRLSARELMHTIADIYGMDEKAADARIEEITEILDLSSFIDNRIERLSTGQTQRVSIARCLVHSPSVYIFDEPTLGLDILSSESIVDFMMGERDHGRTVLYSTHYMEEAQYLCDRILMMYKGHIVAEGTPEELMDKTGTKNLRETFRKMIEEEI